MKNLLILFVFIASSFTLGAQSMESFFNRLEEGDDYAVITVNREMFKMLASMDIDVEGKGLRELIGSIKMLKVYMNEDGASIDDFNQINAIAKGQNLNNLISVKEKGERVMLYTGPSKSDEIVDGVLLLVHEEDQNFFIKIDGLINLNNLVELSKDINIDGLDKLKKIEKTKKM